MTSYVDNANANYEATIHVLNRVCYLPLQSGMQASYISAILEKKLDVKLITHSVDTKRGVS